MTKISPGIFTAMVLLLLPILGARAEESAVSAAAGILKNHIMVPPHEVVWGECPPEIPAGAKCAIIEGDPAAPDTLYAFRSKMPDNYRIPAHYHPMDEHLTVISGTFAMGLGEEFDEKALQPMVAGSYMVMPSRAPHYAMTRGETILQIHGIGPMVFTYVDPTDDPRNR